MSSSDILESRLRKASENGEVIDLSVDDDDDDDVVEWSKRVFARIQAERAGSIRLDALRAWWQRSVPGVNESVLMAEIESLKSGFEIYEKGGSLYVF